MSLKKILIVQDEKAISDIIKFNPYHDRLGRFTGPGGYSVFSANPETKAGLMAIKRAQKLHPTIGAAYGTLKTPGQKAQEKKDRASSRKAKEILEDYGVTTNKKAIQAEITDLYRNADQTNSIHVNDDGKIGIKRSALQSIMDISEKAADNVIYTDDSTKAEYEAIHSWVKRTPIKISDYDKKSIADYNDFRRGAFGNITVSNNGISIDSFFQELSGRFPDYFDSSRTTNPADQLVAVNDVINSLRPKLVNLSGELRQSYIKEISNDILRGYFSRQLCI